MSSQLELWPDEAPGDRFSWSVSRERRLRDCPRKYFLHHFGSRGGWLADAPPERRQAYVLRHLRSRFMWVGEVVHELIELAMGALRRGEQVSADGLVERGTRRMRAQWAESLQGGYWERPSVALGLLEHEYRHTITREEWQAQRDRMERCVRGFLSLPLVDRIRAMPAWRWLALESLASFELDGATVLVKPDFAWREPQGVFIADWKTGKPRPEDEQLQLAIYGLYAVRNWGVRDEGLKGVVVHLEGEAGPSSDEHHLDQQVLASARDYVRASIATMRELALGPDEPEASRFPKTEERERCTYCPFQRLCGR